MIGQTLGHYKILDKLGAGGMGEVYRAKDTTLDREVALKILPPEMAENQERLDRFQREAKTLAALDHPNIVHIYTVEEADGVRFLTMQLVEGRPLSEMIPKGGMLLERIFEIAIPLADALATAHERGVIHRDLKPANIMVTEEGRVKVLDFGLAKLRPDAASASATALPTEPLTEEGRILGTVPYMSPEQVEGGPIDHRSDLFSVGVMLYEMATGNRPFQGGSPASTMSSILRDSPVSVTEHNSDLPRDLVKIIRRCLVKVPEHRFQTARELAIELREVRDEVASGEAWGMATPPHKRHRRIGWGGVGAPIILVAAILCLLLWFHRSNRNLGDEKSPPQKATLTKLVFDTSRKGKVTASPNSRFFAFASDASGNWDIYLQRIEGGNAINLTEDCSEDDRQPAFSPDGESIVFRSEREGGGLFVMGATGESVRQVADHGFFPEWSPDGSKVAYSTSSKLGAWLDNLNSRVWILDLTTGQSQMLLDRSAMMPAWSPSGLRIVYQGYWEPSKGRRQIDLFTIAAEGGEPVPVTNDNHYDSSPTWVASDSSLYFVSERAGSRDVWKAPIEERSGRVVGRAEPMTTGASLGEFISTSDDGKHVLFSSDLRTSEIFNVPFDPKIGTVVGPGISLTPPSLQAANPSVSPDGGWIAFDAEFGRPGFRSIGVVRANGTDLRQLTHGDYKDRYPRWSPDGQRLTLWTNRSGLTQAWIINKDGGGLRQLTDRPGQAVSPAIWSPDGSQLAVCSIDGTSSFTFRADTPWSEEPPTALPPFGSPEERFCPWSWSPDGRLLAGAYYVEVGEERAAVYSLDYGNYGRLADQLVAESLWVEWLNDSRRLLLNAQDKERSTIFVLDTESGRYYETLSSDSLSEASGPFGACPSLSPDDQSLVIARLQFQGDIWMLTFSEQD